MKWLRTARAAETHRPHRSSDSPRYWEDSAPRIWPPPHTFKQTHRLARRVLPGVRYRRLLLWRYSLVWTKPAPGASAGRAARGRGR
jgi:hypothetical protein